LVVLVAAAFALSGCYEHHTADAALEVEPVVESSNAADADAAVATPSAEPCAEIAEDDILGQIVCDFSQGGGTQTPSASGTGQPDLTALLGGLLGGGGEGTGQLDIASLLGLLGGATGTNTGTGQLDIASLLGLLGGSTETQGNPGSGGQFDLAGLLELLGGSGSGSGAPNTPREGATGGPERNQSRP
jgi:hypothetical protein